MILNTTSCLKQFNDKNGYEDDLYVNLIMSLEIFNDFFCHYVRLGTYSGEIWLLLFFPFFGWGEQIEM